jgi:hypothetical protein
MSNNVIARSPDLQRLRAEGYNIEIRGGRHLLVHDIPHITPQKAIARGTLVSPLDLDVDKTRQPDNHQTWFTGAHPCDINTNKIGSITHSSQTMNLAEGLEVNHAFSYKPASGRYTDYYTKMVAYIDIIVAHAQKLDPTLTARTFPLVVDEDDDSPFLFAETASSRAGIAAISDKLRGHRVAIVGVGGTGSYILDLVAKTMVAEIHLFDDDRFHQHTAFRSPGATGREDILAHRSKVDLYVERYSKMRKGVVPHGQIDESTVELLRDLDFVFIAIDENDVKPLLINRLESYGVPFIDVGMGVHAVDDALVGQLRMTLSTSGMREHVREKYRIPLADAAAPNDYDQNIQVVELNALNAAIAVIRWKKLFGFYVDLEGEHFSAYQIDGNTLINEDHAA